MQPAGLLARIGPASDNRATDWYRGAWPAIWQAGTELGVDPAVMAAQCAKETGWGTFGGAVTPAMNNLAGIKVANPTGDATADHATFPNLLTGALAQAQHLHRYATTAPLPVGIPVVDPRYSRVTAGSAPNVRDLGGRWAPSPTYGLEVEAIYRRLTT